MTCGYIFSLWLHLFKLLIIPKHHRKNSNYYLVLSPYCVPNTVSTHYPHMKDPKQCTKYFTSLFLTTVLYIRPINIHFKSEEHTQLVGSKVLNQIPIYPTPSFIELRDLSGLLKQIQQFNVCHWQHQILSPDTTAGYYHYCTRCQNSSQEAISLIQRLLKVYVSTCTWYFHTQERNLDLGKFELQCACGLSTFLVLG